MEHAGRGAPPPVRTQSSSTASSTSAATTCRPARNCGRWAAAATSRVPTPIVADGTIYITNAHGHVRADLRNQDRCASGDITAEGNEAIRADGVDAEPRRRLHADTARLRGASLQLPRQRRAERLRREDRRTNSPSSGWPRAKTGFTASAVAADGKVYFTSEDGDIYVIKAGPTFELLSKNTMGESAWRRRRSDRACCSSGRRGRLVRHR